MGRHHLLPDNEDKDGVKRTINRVTGWMTSIPEVGDELRCPMQSGKTARFKITTVKECGAPRDMFFASVDMIGYVEGK